MISLVAALSLIAWTGAYAQDAGDSGAAIEINDDDSVNDSGNTSVDAQYQSQNCTVIVNQYNDVVAGDAVSGDAAVAQTAAEVNAPVNVVQNCIQAGGDVILGDSPTANPDEDTDEDTDEEETPSPNRESEVVDGTYPKEVLANTGGISPLLPVSAALVGAGLLGFGLLRRR